MAVTRLGLYGGPRVPYGSFAGKVEAPIEEVIEIESGGSTLKQKLSRKEKKRQKKLDQSEKIKIALFEEAARRRRIAAQDSIPLRTQTGDVPPASIPEKVEKQPDIEPRPFIPDTRLLEGLLVPGESSGFIRQAIEREQAVKAEQELIEQKRLEILADDEAVIALYLKQEQELIETFLATK